MSAKIQPTAAPSTTVSMPSPNLSLSDPHTWALLVAAIASAVSVIFHKDISNYAPLITISVTGLYGAILALAKHEYAGAIATANQTLSGAVAVAPTDLVSQIRQAQSIMTAIQGVTSAATPIVKAVENLPSSSMTQAPAPVTPA